MNIAEVLFDLEPKPRSHFDRMTDAEIEVAIASGIVERLPDGMLRVTPMGAGKFLNMAPSLMKASMFAEAAGVTDVREMAQIAYLFYTGNGEELMRRYPCPCERCAAEKAGLSRDAVEGTGTVN